MTASSSSSISNQTEAENKQSGLSFDTKPIHGLLKDLQLNCPDSIQLFNGNSLPQDLNSFVSISNNLKSAFSSAHLNAQFCTALFRLLSELCRNDSFRLQILEQGWFDLILENYRGIQLSAGGSAAVSWEYHAQFCRCLANMIPANETLCGVLVEHPVLDMVVQGLIHGAESPEQAEALKFACVLCLNFCVSLEPAGFERLAQFEGLGQRLLQIMCNAKYPEDLEYPAMLAQLYVEFDSNSFSKLTVESGLFERLGEKLSTDLRRQALELLLELSNLDLDIFKSHIFSYYDKFTDFTNDEAVPVEERHVAAKLVTLLVSDDKYHDESLTEQNVQIFKKWLSSDDNQMKMFGGLCLGNLCRSDKDCMFLVNNSVLECLLGNVETDDLNVKHAIVGALRNLSISSDARPSLYNAGVIDKILPILESTRVEPLQKGCLGVLKSIVSLEAPRIAIKTINGKNICEYLVELSKKSDEEGVKYESIRVLCAILKNCSDSQSYQSILQSEAVPLFIELIEARFPVLQQEGLSSILRLLIASPDSLMLAIESYKDRLALALREKIGEADISPDLLANTISISIFLINSENNNFSEIETLKETISLRSAAILARSESEIAKGSNSDIWTQIGRNLSKTLKI